MSVAKPITDFLNERGVKYSIDHHATCFTAQNLAAEEALSGYAVGKCVVGFVDGKPVILVLPAPYQVDWDAVCDELDADEARLAEPDEIAEIFTGCAINAPPPALPLWDGVAIVADETMMGDYLPNNPLLVMAAGSAQDAIRMDRADWLAIVQPSVANFAVLPDTAPANEGAGAALASGSVRHA